MITTVRKAVFPVAGLGTRFLPATKVIPKEMLPVVDKPLIQYAVEEAMQAGIDEFIFITRDDKASVIQHFRKAPELEEELTEKKKQDLLEYINYFSDCNITLKSVIQEKPLGLGHAVLCAMAAVGNEPFAVILADDLIHNPEQGCLAQMVSVFAGEKSSVIAVETVPKEDTNKYGIVSVQKKQEALGLLSAIVEKPEPDKAPSNLAVVGRYILTPAIFRHLQSTPKGAGGEIQLTDAIAALMQEEQVYCWEFKGKRYDCGSKLGYLQANVEYALEHPALGGDFSGYLNRLAMK